MKHILCYKIFEGKGALRSTVRQLVKDVLYVFKNEKEGEFDLPFEIDGEDYYQFPNVESEFNIELTLNKDVSVGNFELDGGFYNDDKIIELVINYNPHRVPKLYYSLIGELNEVIRHELEHVKHPLLGEEPKDPEEYYTQPHEIKAQLAGFRRLAKLRRQKLEYVIRNWFYKHKNMHRMNGITTERVIQKILSEA
jgi:hypothetical protein